MIVVPINVLSLMWAADTYKALGQGSVPWLVPLPDFGVLGDRYASQVSHTGAWAGLVLALERKWRMSVQVKLGQRPPPPGPGAAYPIQPMGTLDGAPLVFAAVGEYGQTSDASGRNLLPITATSVSSIAWAANQLGATRITFVIPGIEVGQKFADAVMDKRFKDRLFQYAGSEFEIAVDPLDESTFYGSSSPLLRSIASKRAFLEHRYKGSPKLPEVLAYINDNLTTSIISDLEERGEEGREALKEWRSVYSGVTRGILPGEERGPARVSSLDHMIQQAVVVVYGIDKKSGNYVLLHRVPMDRGRLDWGGVRGAIEEYDASWGDDGPPVPASAAAALVLEPVVRRDVGNVTQLHHVPWAKGVGIPDNILVAVKKGISIGDRKVVVLADISGGGIRVNQWLTKTDVGKLLHYILSTSLGERGLISGPIHNLLSYPVIAQKNLLGFKRTLTRLGEDHEKEAYYDVLSYRLVGRSGFPPGLVRAGRAFREVQRGAKTGVARRVGAEWVGREGELAVKTPIQAPTGLLALGRSVVRELELSAVPTEPQKEMAEGYPFSRAVYDALVATGIPVPPPTDRAGLKAALETLKERVSPTFLYEPEHGKVAEGGSEFEREYLSRLNPRRPRRPRRARRQRRSRYNPLDPQDIAPLAVAAERGQDIEDEALREKIEKISVEAADWSESVPALFPKRGKLKDYRVEPRFSAALTEHDISRRLLPPSSDPESGRPYQTEPKPWVEGSPYLAQQSQLSLSDAARIVRQQRASRKSDRAMQSSSAVCKMQRVVRAAYDPPPEFFGKGGPEKVVLLLSPVNSPFPRVMTFRRNAHIDCDMGSRKGEPVDLGQLMGRAIQSTMLWLAEKPGRKLNTTVYVARVGDGRLYVAWEPNSQVSIQKITATLAGHGGKGIPYLGKRKPEEDVAEYERAVRITKPYRGTVTVPVKEAVPPAEIEETEAPFEEEDIFRY